MEKIAKESDDSDEYFDAKDDANSLCKWSSLEYVNKHDAETLSTDDLDRSSRLSTSKTPNSLSKESLANSERRLINKKCPNSILIFVLHGGHLLDCGNEPNNKFTDFSVLKSTFEQIIRTSFTSLSGRISFRLICCPLICKSSLQFLSKLSTSYQSNHGRFDYENLPIDCLPLFATNQNDYQNQINRTIDSINQSYSDFIESDDGKHFNGRIAFICDFLGGLLAYDSLCNLSKSQTKSDEIENDGDNNDNATNYSKLNKYNFQIDDLFLFGCPLSLVLAYRKLILDGKLLFLFFCCSNICSDIQKLIFII